MRPARTRTRRHTAACLRAALGLLAAGSLHGCAAAVPVSELPPTPATAATAPVAPSATAETPASAPTAGAPSVLASARNRGRERWSDLVKDGRTSLQLGKLADAEDSFTRAYDLTRAYRHGDPRTRTSISNLERVAAAYLAAGDGTGFGRVMDLLVFVSGETSEARTLELAQLLQSLATTRTLQGRPDDAREALELSLAIVTEQKGADDAASVGIHTQLALTEISLGDLDDAQVHVDRAAQIASAAGGERSIPYAKTLLARATLEHARGDDDAAQKTLVTAVDIHEETLGPNDPATARVVRELAMFEQKAGRDGEAEKSFQRVVDIWDAVPNGAFQRAQSRNELAWFFVETGQPAKAEAPARSALAMLEDQKKDGQPVAAVADTLATALRDQGKLAEAEPLYQRALAEAAKAQALPGWSAAPIALRYAELLEETGRDRQAQELRDRFAHENDAQASVPDEANVSGP